MCNQGQCFKIFRFQVWKWIEGSLICKITVSQQERYIEMPVTCNVESLNSTNNSPLAFVQGVRDAQKKVSARNLLFRRWWCTCSVQVHVSLSCFLCS